MRLFVVVVCSRSMKERGMINRECAGYNVGQNEQSSPANAMLYSRQVDSITNKWLLLRTFNARSEV